MIRLLGAIMPKSSAYCTVLTFNVNILVLTSFCKHSFKMLSPPVIENINFLTVASKPLRVKLAKIGLNFPPWLVGGVHCPGQF